MLTSFPFAPVRSLLDFPTKKPLTVLLLNPVFNCFPRRTEWLSPKALLSPEDRNSQAWFSILKGEPS